MEGTVNETANGATRVPATTAAGPAALAPTPTIPATSDGRQAASLDGRRDGAIRRGALLTPSSYQEYLPAPYQGDEFVGRFLLIFESILAPIERTIDQVAYYFDPHLTPPAMLPWLASWLGLELDENWPPAKQRALVAAAARLYRARGTRAGLREHLQIYTGRRPLIVENCDGLRLGQDATLGVNTRVATPRDHTIAVTVVVDRPDDVDEHVIRRIIETEKPAGAAYTLEIVAAGD